MTYQEKARCTLERTAGNKEIPFRTRQTSRSVRELGATYLQISMKTRVCGYE